MTWFLRKLPTDLKLLLPGLLASLALLIFCLIANAAMTGGTKAFDEAIMLALRVPGDLAQPIGPAWLTRVARDITALGGGTIITLITIAVLVYLLLMRHRRTAALVASAILGGWGLSTLLKNLIARPRPDLVAHLVDVQTLSFPSGHAMLAAITYLTLAELLARREENRRMKIYLLSVAGLLAVLIGCSRVYLGVHWPTDVVAGWALGLAWALFWRMVDDALIRRTERLR